MHSLNFGWGQIVADLLPRDLALDQMPNRIDCNGVPFRIEYQLRVNEKDELLGALIVLTDETERFAKEQSEQMARDRIRAFQCIMRDKAGFLAFIADDRENCLDALMPIASERPQTCHTHGEG